MAGGHCKTLQNYNTLYHKSDTREVTIYQYWSLILFLITIVCLSLLPSVFVHAKELGNNSLYYKGLILDKLGNDTGAIQYFDKALAIDPNDEAALYNKNNSFDHLGFLVSKPRW